MAHNYRGQLNIICKVIYSILGRSHFTRHGLHFSRQGKHLLGKHFCSSIKNLCRISLSTQGSSGCDEPLSTVASTVVEPTKRRDTAKTSKHIMDPALLDGIVILPPSESPPTTKFRTTPLPNQHSPPTHLSLFPQSRWMSSHLAIRQGCFGLRCRRLTTQLCRSRGKA